MRTRSVRTKVWGAGLITAKDIQLDMKKRVPLFVLAIGGLGVFGMLLVAETSHRTVALSSVDEQSWPPEQTSRANPSAAQTSIARRLIPATSSDSDQSPNQLRHAANQSEGVVGEANVGRPHVVFDGVQLTIVAESATANDVLGAIRDATGVIVDVPDGATEQVNIRLGPARERDVLQSLLSTLRYDYVLVSSEATPSLVSHIILSARRDSVMPSGTSPSSSPAILPAPMPIEQSTVADKSPDAIEEIKQQQRMQYERQFGACIAQGCDAS